MKALSIVTIFLVVFTPLSAAAAEASAPTITLDLPISTQGPLWPPSEIIDSEGNFIVVGLVLTETDSGDVVLVPSQAVIVSKDTVPPLDAGGREDFSNPFGTPYTVLRQLDLTRGSEDLNMVLYTNSFGPPVGNFGGGPRIPKEGESLYNLNSLPFTCPELFPSSSQGLIYRRPSFPLHQAPIWGFQGNQKIYGVDTGNARVEPEQVVDFRRQDPITLGAWLAAKGKVKITLTQFDPTLGAYTHARFKFVFNKLLPNSLYTIWAVRANVVLGLHFPDPIAMPNVFITDKNGEAKVSYEVRNPFPDAETEFEGKRIIGLGVDFHSDFQNWGGCFARFGAGVDIHNQLNTQHNDGTTDITNFVTVEPLDRLGVPDPTAREGAR